MRVVSFVSFRYLDTDTIKKSWLKKYLRYRKDIRYSKGLYLLYLTVSKIQRRPRIRAMLNRSNLLIVQNLISTERNGLSCSKITLLIVQKPS